jgi:hypothetical protein
MGVTKMLGCRTLTGPPPPRPPPLPLPPAWGDCPGSQALRAMSKTCSSFSSPGTCKSIGPLCRWNDMVRACLATGAGQATWVLGANATDMADAAKHCAKANNQDACNSVGTVSVDPKLFASVQRGDFSAATNGAAGRVAAASGAALATALAAAAALLL